MKMKVKKQIDVFKDLYLKRLMKLIVLVTKS